MRKSVLVMGLFDALLSGCATTQGGVLRCPALVEYPPADQRQAAQEMKVLLPASSQVAKMIVDYGQLRDAVRASCAIEASK